MRNQFIAAYCVGGDELLKKVADMRLEKDRPIVIQKLCEDVKTKCAEDRAFISDRQKMSFGEFVDKWRCRK